MDSERLQETLQKVNELRFVQEDHCRRLERLEREKLGTSVALMQRDIDQVKDDVKDMKASLYALTRESQERVGGVRSWRNVWVYIVGGMVAAVSIITPFITIYLARGR